MIKLTPILGNDNLTVCHVFDSTGLLTGHVTIHKNMPKIEVRGCIMPYGSFSYQKKQKKAKK